MAKLEVKLADAESKASVMEARLLASKSKVVVVDARVWVAEE